MPHAVYYCYDMIGFGSSLILKCFDILIDIEQVLFLLPKKNFVTHFAIFLNIL